MDGPSFLEDPAFLSPHSMGRYLETLRRKGCAEATIQSYRRNLDFFYHALPEDKRIGPGALEGWKQQMIEKGYTAGTINHRLTTVNGYLGFVGLRNYQVSYLSRENREEPAPELSRQEYLRLLSAAKALDRQRTYLLIKTIAVTGLAIHELPCLTVEAVGEGAARVPQGSSRRVVPIPRCLQRELLAYSGKKELAAGPVFVTRNGRLINRSHVSMEIQALAKEAGVPPEKCNPRCLRKLYQATRQQLTLHIALMVEQAHERLLEEEQRKTGWDSP